MNWQELHAVAEAHEAEKAERSRLKRDEAAMLRRRFCIQAPSLLEPLLKDALKVGSPTIRIRLDNCLEFRAEHLSESEVKSIKIWALHSAVEGWGDAVPCDADVFQVGIGDKTRAYIKQMLEGGNS